MHARIAPCIVAAVCVCSNMSWYPSSLQLNSRIIKLILRLTGFSEVLQTILPRFPFSFILHSKCNVTRKSIKRPKFEGFHSNDAKGILGVLRRAQWRVFLSLSFSCFLILPLWALKGPSSVTTCGQFAFDWRPWQEPDIQPDKRMSRNTRRRRQTATDVHLCVCSHH